ncbi:MAG: hypothetical protein C3F14_03925 [Deltaproteobacteria bacterium]|nr:MAG: hypothetical protein C3F14_03925 [Deltaproteobacteria bacterium]
MKTSTVGTAAVVLLFVTGSGIGTAQAGGTDRNVEGQDSIIGYATEGRKVTYFHLHFSEDEEQPQEAKSASEDMQPENPIETGSFPAGRPADFPFLEVGGIPYRVKVDVGP